jgi:hypothetical protein
MAAKPKPGSMDALKALIESKKRKGAPAGAADANGNGVPAAAKKYKTKAEIEAEARRAKEEEEQKVMPLISFLHVLCIAPPPQLSKIPNFTIISTHTRDLESNIHF